MYLLQEISNELPKLIYLIAGLILGAIFTFITQWLLQRENYKKEYYKQIISRRLDAYKLLEELIQIIGAYHEIIQDKKMFHKIFVGIKEFEDFYSKFSKVAEIKYWYNNDLYMKVNELNLYLNEIRKDIPVMGEFFPDIGIKHFHKLNSLHVDLHRLLFKDLRTLYDIRKFMKIRDIRFSKFAQNQN